MIQIWYHAHCQDGFAAAWVARKKAGDVKTVPVTYGAPPPTFEPGEWIWIVDFSYPVDVLEGILDRAGALTIIDHHKTAEADLQALRARRYSELTGGKLEIIFDKSHCGAVLAWKHWFAEHPLPWILSHVESRDLWTWREPHSQEINAWLSSQSRDFTTWDALMAEPQTHDVWREGSAILRYQQRQVEIAAEQFEMFRIGPWVAPALNATSLISEIGEALCLDDRHAFSATYRLRHDGARIWSLRSRHSFDVSQVARLFGGGGHTGAAGFTEALPWFIWPESLMRDGLPRYSGDESGPCVCLEDPTGTLRSEWSPTGYFAALKGAERRLIAPPEWWKWKGNETE